MEKMSSTVFSKWLYDFRKSRELEQFDAAEELGFSLSLYEKLEDGKTYSYETLGNNKLEKLREWIGLSSGAFYSKLNGEEWTVSTSDLVEIPFSHKSDFDFSRSVAMPQAFFADIIPTAIKAMPVSNKVWFDNWIRYTLSDSTLLLYLEKGKIKPKDGVTYIGKFNKQYKVRMHDDSLIDKSSKSDLPVIFTYRKNQPYIRLESFSKANQETVTTYSDIDFIGEFVGSWTLGLSTYLSNDLDV